jgi:hypothetical protein
MRPQPFYQPNGLHKFGLQQFHRTMAIQSAERRNRNHPPRALVQEIVIHFTPAAEPAKIFTVAA